MIVKKINEWPVSLHSWHTSAFITNDEGSASFYVLTTPSGCGTMQIAKLYFENQKAGIDLISKFLDNINKHMSYFTPEEKKAQINIAPSNFIHPTDIGMIMTTLGEGYMEQLQGKVLKECGFKPIAKYANPRHGYGAKQFLLIWTTPSRSEYAKYTELKEDE